VKPPRTSRVVAHSLWLTVAVLAVLIFATQIAWGSGRSANEASGVLAIAIMLSPVWAAAAVLAGAATGLATGWSAGLAGYRFGRGAQVAAGATASGVVAGLLGWALLATGTSIGGVSTLGFLAGSGGVGIVTGGVAVLLAQKADADASRVRALAWSTATVVLVCATFLDGCWTWLTSASWDSTQSCAVRLGVDDSQVVFVNTVFPPQLWCLSGDRAEPSVAGWAGALLIVVITATVISGLVAGWHAWGSRERPVLVSCLVIGLTGVGGALLMLAQHPPQDAVERAHVAATRAPTPRPTPPSAQPGTRPRITAPIAKATVSVLAQVVTARRPGLVWPQRPAITQADCSLADGTSGTRFLLNARFTTRDLAEVHGPTELLKVSQANEQVAGLIVHDWLASGLVAGVDQVHGEWFLGAPTGGAVDAAHIGFTDAVGTLSVTTVCAYDGPR